MEELIARVQAVLDRFPGPGKLLFGNLTADRKSFAALAACLVAILCTYLTPPVITLGSPPVEAGLRDIGSGAPVASAQLSSEPAVRKRRTISRRIGSLNA